jgi:magnesium chelatase subunit D
MSLLLDAYQKRDRVGMISFRRREAQLNLPPTNSIELAGRLLAELPIGGRTPLNAGLVKAYAEARNHLLREPSGRPILIILTDGKGNVSLGSDKPLREMEKIVATLAREERIKYIVIDTEEAGPVTFDLARRLAAGLGADYFRIQDLAAGELLEIVNQYK